MVIDDEMALTDIEMGPSERGARARDVPLRNRTISAAYLVGSDCPSTYWDGWSTICGFDQDSAAIRKVRADPPGFASQNCECYTSSQICLRWNGGDASESPLTNLATLGRFAQSLAQG